MSSNNTDLISKMFEYNLWANTQIIEICSGLVDEQLVVEAEGVFGRIQPTIVHIVRAEGGYLNRLTGAAPWADDLDWDTMSMRDLLANAKLSGTQLIDVAGSVDPARRHDVTVAWQDDQIHFFNWTVLLQVLYHGIEHRTQIKILLTQLGVSHPELAAWDYTDSLL